MSTVLSFSLLLIIGILLVIAAFHLWKAYDLFKKQQPEPPKISTPYGYTTEWARQQAVANMKADPEKRKAVLQLLVDQAGDEAKGKLEFQKRFPELKEKA